MKRKKSLHSSHMSSKALLLSLLRKKQGAPSSGSILAKSMGVSRVAVWKTVQSLTEAGYSIETSDSGYLLDPEKEKDFLFPWEFGEKENQFFHYLNTGSTMDRARELAFDGAPGGTVITAEKQSAGRGRHGRAWVSRQGGLFFSFLERPRLSIADYTFLSIIMQIAVVRTVSSICGKQAFLRWPNDVYINRRKIAGITSEISGEGDLLTWFCGGIGVNVNNTVPSGKAASLTEVTGSHVSRRDVLLNVLDEIEKVKKTFSSTAAYFQGNRAIAAEWNSLSDCIGAKVAVFEPGGKGENYNIDKPGKILARGTFAGIDPAGRCILKTGGDKGDLYFNQGSVSLSFLHTS